MVSDSNIWTQWKVHVCFSTGINFMVKGRVTCNPHKIDMNDYFSYSSKKNEKHSLDRSYRKLKLFNTFSMFFNISKG